MSENELHPTVIEFKKFINEHPKLITEVRKNGDPWQYYYEKWVLLGETDPSWEKFKNKNKETKKTTPELFDQLMKLAENIDLNKVQKHVQQFNKMLPTIQAVLNEFIDNNSTSQHAENRSQLFNWYRD